MTTIREKMSALLMPLAAVVFASTRRALLISAAITITGMLYFGFWVWIGFTLLALLCLYVYIKFEERIYPTTN